MRVLVGSGSTGNYIDARECTARRIKIEAEDWSEELKMADGRWQMALWSRLKGEFNSFSNVVGTEVKFPPGFFPI